MAKRLVGFVAFETEGIEGCVGKSDAVPLALSGYDGVGFPHAR